MSGLSVLYVAFLATAGVAADTLPVPDADARQAALQLARDVYEKDYQQATTKTKKLALARKLLAEAGQTEEPAEQFVLLEEAKRLATEAGNVPMTVETIDRMAAAFQIDVLKIKASTLWSMARATRDNTQRKAIAERSLTLIEEAVIEDRFEMAEKISNLAVGTARKTRNGQLVRKIVDDKKQLPQLHQEFAAAKEAMEVLEGRPADPAANLAVGRYRCLVKGDWRRGLPMLALGDDPELKELARRELEGPKSSLDQIALAGGWWALAEQAEGFHRRNLRRQAVRWYREALPRLEGIERKIVEKKLKQIDVVATPATATPPGAAIPEDAQQYRGHYYKVFRARLTWHLAGQECEKMGGHLVRIESAGEQEFVNGLIGPGQYAFWIDGSDETREGDWRFGNGQRITYSNWDSENPSNHYGGEHALEIRQKYGGRWNDNASGRRHPFICEWDGRRRPPARLGRTRRPPPPPKGARRFGEHHYMLFDMRLTWHLARRQCEALGGHLARIETAEEQQFVASLISVGRRKKYWLDGSDEVVEGRWVFGNGKELTYTNWDTNEPNNQSGLQHCLQIYRGRNREGRNWHGLWDDDNAGSRKGFVCEWDY